MFTGIEARKIKDYPGEVYRGSPCLYKKHSGNAGSAHSWRTTDTHACLECIEDIKSGHFSLDLGQYTAEALPYVKRFWKSVDIEEWDNCWPWIGKLSKSKHLFYMWPRPEISSNYKHHPIRVLNWIARGDIGLSGINSRCNERRCANPFHQLPDFLDQPNVSSSQFKQERIRLLAQLKEAAKPEYESVPDTTLIEAKMEFAYEEMLHFYHNKVVRQTIK